MCGALIARLPEEVKLPALHTDAGAAKARFLAHFQSPLAHDPS
jgi:hypothetical protein